MIKQYTINEIKTIEQNTSGIYKITNLTNNKHYYGQTICFRTRFNEHLSTLAKGDHNNQYMQNDYNKTGAKPENIIFEIVELCQINQLDEIEQIYIDQYHDNQQNCFNISRIAGAPMRGLKHSEETKRKIGDAHKGMKRSEETKKNISNALKNTKNDSFKTQNRIPVFQYDSNGNFIKEYVSQSEAAREIIKNNEKYKNCSMSRMVGYISITSRKNKELNKNNKTYKAYDFVWTLDFFGDKIEVYNAKVHSVEDRKKISEKVKIGLKSDKAQEMFFKRKINSYVISQFGLDGKYIKTWDNAKEIEKQLNINKNSILECCLRKIDNFDNCIWRFLHDNKI